MRRILLGLFLVACSSRGPEPRPAPAAVTVALDTALQAELLRRLKLDQDARFALIAKQQEGRAIDSLDVVRLTDIDTANTAWVRRVVAQRGWPGWSMVGRNASQAAFLFVQHADRDTAFQAAMLPLLEKAYRAGDASGQDFALLTDRVAVARGRPQVFGSQAQFRDGRVVLQPIADSESVDARRAEVGLPPLAGYVRELAEMYLPRASSTTAPQHSREYAESAVYAVVLTSVFGDHLPDTVVLAESTLVFRAPSGRGVDSWRREYEEFPPALVAALVEASRNTQSASALNIIARPVRLFSDIDRTQLRGKGPGEFWSAFRTRFSGAPGILAISPVAFSPDGRQALVYYDYSCGGRCGHGDLIWLELGLDNRWTVRKILNFRMV